jgi:hypothetical protein
MHYQYMTPFSRGELNAGDEKPLVATIHDISVSQDPAGRRYRGACSDQKQR